MSALRQPHPRRQRPTLRRGLAVGITAAMAGVGALAVLPAAQAATSTATGPVKYSCTYQLGATTSDPFDLMVDIDTDAPASIALGQKVTAKVTSSTSLPGSMALLAYTSLGARFFDGTSLANYSVAGPPTQVQQPIAMTPITAQPAAPAPGVDVPFKAIGAIELTGSKLGAMDITTGDFTTDIHLYTATVEGGPQQPAALTVPVTCTAPPGRPAVVDTVNVVASTTTAVRLDTSDARYGETVTATAQVTASSGMIDGEVAFTLNGVATKTRVNKDGVATLALPVAPVGTHELTASFVPKDPTSYATSTSAPVSLQVRKAKTRARISVTGKRTHRATKVTVKVNAHHGTTATGKVRIVVRKIGTKKKVVRTRALRDGQRTVGFGKLGKGRYKVNVRYSGDKNHMRGPKVKRTFRVKRG